MGDRYTHWIPKTNYKDMRGDVLAVADSPYLMIRFDKHAASFIAYFFKFKL
jgi:hypothetical protein